VVRPKKIIAVATDETTPLRAALDRARREVSLLGEFRTRLIGDVVTGKLDVREASARPSDEPNKADLLIHCANHSELTYRGGQEVHLEVDLHEVVAWATANERR
jgi:hypothetical protein